MMINVSSSTPAAAAVVAANGLSARPALLPRPVASTPPPLVIKQEPNHPDYSQFLIDNIK
jgi:hypothetical protein